MIELVKFNVNYGSIQEQLPQQLVFTVRNEKTWRIQASQLDGSEFKLGKTAYPDGLIAIFEYQESVYYVHAKDHKVYCTPYLNNKTEGSLNISIQALHERFEVTSTELSYQVRDTYNDVAIELDYSTIFEVGRKPWITDEVNREGDPAIFIKIQYASDFTFLEYTHAKRDFSFKTHHIDVISDSELQFDFNSANEFVVWTSTHQQRIRLSNLKKDKDARLDDDFLRYQTRPVYLKLDNRLYIISYRNGKLSIKTDKENDLLYQRSEVKVQKSLRHIIFSGQIDYHATIRPTELVTKAGESLGKVKWSRSGQFEAKVKIKQLPHLTQIHNTVFMALNGKMVHPLHQMKQLNDQAKVVRTFNYKGHAIIIRRNAANNLSIGNLPALKIYQPWHKWKISIAAKVAPIVKFLMGRRNVNVYFEKEASKAVESGKYVFEAAASDRSTKATNRFILDRTSPQYKEMKKKWGKKIVERFSFKNYLYVFLADYFIASELSNHAINTRIFNDRLNRKIQATPLYFLQHGITFLKPRGDSKNVGFHKKNMTNNVVKSVVSSEVEAKIFNELGYNDFELMKTGMPKFDNAQLIPNANKITYMPTWRPWEESAVVNGDIKKTTYYQSMVEVIQAFEQAGLLDRLQIAAHNKFAHYAKDLFKDYADLFVEDPTDTLKNSVIYITDISSIIFDAINHGAFPIFFWKEFDDIIAKHGGTTPANRDNVPGVVADDEHELVALVQKAINTNYHLPEKVRYNYRQINEFDDNRNTERVIQELKNDKVL